MTAAGALAPVEYGVFLAVSPAGELLLERGESEWALADSPVSRRIAAAFERGEGLFHLGASEVQTALPAAFAFWRDFARRFIGALCAVPDLEVKRDEVRLPPPPREELEALVGRVPPMFGAEYLTAEVLERQWIALNASFSHLAGGFEGSIQELLARRHPTWNVVGRVHLHLAENRKSEEAPFAFLATFTTGVSAAGRPVHRALGDAVRESSSARDRDRLLALLRPVQKAAEKSALIKELFDTRQLFEPQAWTASDAYRFLNEVPALEESGVVVRVPDWWKAKRPPRPEVSVKVGSREPEGLGLDALVDFKVEVTLEGEALTAEELKLLRAAKSGLVLLKGRWVEVNREKLQQVLEHWRRMEGQAQEGISFVDGMRLLAGARVDGNEPDAIDREWAGVQPGEWLRSILAELRGETENALAPPSSLQASLRPYQRDGVRWLWLHAQLRLGACLADDMGLGKTIQVLALILLLEERRALRGPHLLIVPASLIANWKAEADRFAPSLRVLIAHASAQDPKSLGALSEDAVGAVDVVITSYGTAQRLPWISGRRWGLVVLDEAQAIKNAGTRQARAVKGIRSEARIALTGTPVENRVGDLWSLFDFINPGLLGTPSQFKQFIKRTESFAPLRELTRPYILRRLKTDRSIIADLPEKTEVPAYCLLSPVQATLYRESVQSLKERISKTSGIDRRGLVLSYLMRFKQICNHPSQWLGDGSYAPEASGKFARLAELCETIASRQEKVLVFTQFKEMTAPLARFLERIFGHPGAVLSGDTAVKKRQQLVERFQQDPRTGFFVLSLKAGGTGLNLTAASHVIHFDRWWNPAVENQATDRAFRIGQKRNVLVHKFICRGTVEDRVNQMIEAKQGLARDLLEGGEELRLTELDDEALLRLVALDVRTAKDAP